MTPPGIDPETVRLVVQCHNHYATPGPQKICWLPVKFQYGVYITGSYFKAEMNTISMRSKQLLIVGEDSNISNSGDFVDTRNIDVFTSFYCLIEVGIYPWI